MAYPRQLRGSADPCESQLFDDSVIQILINRTTMGACVSWSVTVPLRPFEITPDGNATQAPLVGNLIASSPVQYCTTYCLAYGSPQAIRRALIGCGVARSITTHCGCSESSSPVKALLR